MDLVFALVLGLIQGLTEFLPVSSSGHLLLAHHFFGIESQALAFDVALHIGTLMALVLFFRRDIYDLASALLQRNKSTHLAWLLILATLPAVVAGTFLHGLAETSFRSPYLVSVGLIVVAVLMLVAERLSERRSAHDDLTSITRTQALIIGLLQVAALIPGASRSGSTITTGLFVGLSRVAATRFSFLLAIPVTLGAILKVFSDGAIRNQALQNPDTFIVGIVASFISGMLAIKFLLRFVAKRNLNVFAYYRIALGLAVLAVLTFA